MSQASLVGVYDPSGLGDCARKLRAANECPSSERGRKAFDEGALVFAAARPPGEYGGRLCMLDGSLYNAEELVRELGLAPTSAPERVLCTAHERWGEGMLERLRGDFVLLIWEHERGRGILARDQLGGRSLFLSSEGSWLAFASELGPLLGLLPRRPAPERLAVINWLAASEPRGRRTFYERVGRLAPGHCLCLEGGGWEERPYWAPRYRSPLRLPRADLVHGLRAAIAQSVSRRSALGKATGILLSGGLDSGSVAAVAAGDISATRRPAAAYSAVFPRHPSADESELIDRVTARLGLPSVRIALRGGSMLAGALEHQRRWEVPLIAPNDFFLQPLLRRAGEDGVEVMLDGEGGDALFDPSPLMLADRVRRGRILGAIGLARRLPGAGDDPPWPTVLRLVRDYGLKGAVPYALESGVRRGREPQGHGPGWLTPESARVLAESERSLDWKRLDGPRWWAFLADRVTGALEALGAYDYLRRRATPAGLEARHPLLDLDLVELVLRLPPEHAFDPHLSRPLLRASVAGLLPDEVRLRPQKRFFDEVIHRCLAGCDLDVVRRLLSAPDAEVFAYAQPEQVRKGVVEADPASSPRAWAQSAWRLVTAEVWLRSQSDPAFADRLLASAKLAPPDYVLTTVPGLSQVRRSSLAAPVGARRRPGRGGGKIPN